MMTLAYLRRNGVRLHTAHEVKSEAEVEIVRGECHTQAMSIKRMCCVECLEKSQWVGPCRSFVSDTEALPNIPPNSAHLRSVTPSHNQALVDRKPRT
jgi:hypothetical protein